MREGVTAPESWRHQESLRQKRRVSAVHRRRRTALAVGLAALCAVIAGIIVATSAGGSSDRVDSEALLVSGTRSPSAPVAAAGEEHPAFARLGDRNLLLPVAAGDATIIAYKPVSDDRAVALSPIGDQANTNALVRFFRGIFSGEPSVRYYLLEGEGGAVTTSVMVGALAGSPVTSPVSGIVTAVKSYKLYGKYDDVRVDISPDEMSGTTVSLLFIDEPAVSIGELVTAGKTQLGKVRACPEDLGATLAHYTHDPGSHVHLEVTEEPIIP